MNYQMQQFGDGGLNDEGGMIDEVSGNEVPVGGTKEGVRDNIPANVSEGEFIFPEDVTRFIGLDKLMAMRQDAKMGLKKMEAMGQMGNSEEATIPDDMPFGMADLMVVSSEGKPMELAGGGFIPVEDYTVVQDMIEDRSDKAAAIDKDQAMSDMIADNTNKNAAVDKVQEEEEVKNFSHGGMHVDDGPALETSSGPQELDTADVPTFDPSKIPDYDAYTNSVEITAREYRNEAGDVKIITFINGIAHEPIPPGFTLYVKPEEDAVETDADVVIQTLNANNEKFGKGRNPNANQGDTGIDYAGMSDVDFIARMEYENTTGYKVMRAVALGVTAMVPLGGALAYASMRGSAISNEARLKQLINSATGATKVSLNALLKDFYKSNAMKDSANSGEFMQWVDGVLVKLGFAPDQTKKAAAQAVTISEVGYGDSEFDKKIQEILTTETGRGNAGAGADITIMDDSISKNFGSQFRTNAQMFPNDLMFSPATLVNGNVQSDKYPTLNQVQGSPAPQNFNVAAANKEGAESMLARSRTNPYGEISSLNYGLKRSVPPNDASRAEFENRLLEATAPSTEVVPKSTPVEPPFPQGRLAIDTPPAVPAAAPPLKTTSIDDKFSSKTPYALGYPEGMRNLSGAGTTTPTDTEVSNDGLMQQKTIPGFINKLIELAGPSSKQTNQTKQTNTSKATNVVPNVVKPSTQTNAVTDFQVKGPPPEREKVTNLPISESIQTQMANVPPPTSAAPVLGGRGAMPQFDGRGLSGDLFDPQAQQKGLNDPRVNLSSQQTTTPGPSAEFQKFTKQPVVTTSAPVSKEENNFSEPTIDRYNIGNFKGDILTTPSSRTGQTIFGGNNPINPEGLPGKDSVGAIRNGIYAGDGMEWTEDGGRVYTGVNAGVTGDTQVINVSKDVFSTGADILGDYNIVEELFGIGKEKKKKKEPVVNTTTSESKKEDDGQSKQADPVVKVSVRPKTREDKADENRQKKVDKETKAAREASTKAGGFKNRGARAKGGLINKPKAKAKTTNKRGLAARK